MDPNKNLLDDISNLFEQVSKLFEGSPFTAARNVRVEKTETAGRTADTIEVSAAGASVQLFWGVGEVRGRHKLTPANARRLAASLVKHAAAAESMAKDSETK